MRRAILLRAVLLAWAPLAGCGSDHEGSPPPPPPSAGPGDGQEGATLAYTNGHPLNWLTDDGNVLGHEDHLLRIVNEHRVAQGKNALVHDPAMRRAARGHSRHMRPDGHDFFAHENPEGDTAGGRLTRNGVSWAAVGENLAAGPIDAPSAFHAWMSSPAHKSNLESASWRRTGIGYQPGTGSGFATYWSHVFAD